MSIIAFRSADSALYDRMRDRWIELDKTDLDYIGPSRDRLIERLQIRYRMSKLRADQQVARWEQNLATPLQRCLKGEMTKH